MLAKYVITGVSRGATEVETENLGFTAFKWLKLSLKLQT